MSLALLARRVPVSRDLPERVSVPQFTPEQSAAIERREGNLLLDASAGSGKTSVLVERFALAVTEDELDPSAMLTITFTEKAAAEMRQRIRARLRQVGAPAAAQAAEDAPISTIHGFCARLLRAAALAAGLDPEFEVLDRPEAERLAAAALERSLDALATEEPGGIELIAAYGAGALRDGIRELYAELRARGQIAPRLPTLAPAPGLEPLRGELRAAAGALGAELGAIDNPPVRVVQALERLERCQEVVAAGEPPAADMAALALPQGNGAALSTPACERYVAALRAFRDACRHRRSVAPHRLLDLLLARFGAEYDRLKRTRSALDFEDLELRARALVAGDAELRERLRQRYTRVMVDELQDTNAVQLELIQLVSADNLFTVGDAQQSIYGFRHADVELFERLGRGRDQAGERLTLSANFRGRADILDVLNRAFERELGERFRPLRPGRASEREDEPRVELLLADKGAESTGDGLAAPWRITEAAALADRVAELVAGGAAQRDIVVLTRATTDLRVYERALEERSIPTYVIGGRGYWSHPQVVDLVGYLRALANPLDEEALFTVLASPLVGLSLDGLVLLAAAAASGQASVWEVLRGGVPMPPALPEVDGERLGRFLGWFMNERKAAHRVGVSELVERALEHSGYDLQMLAQAGGRRRLANVRKLMRLGREHAAAGGADLRGFLDLVWERGEDPAEGGGDPRESEAPVEGEALDAVRLMTIHRAKGLEFDVVCVADLGRGPMHRAPLMRVGGDGRFGLRLVDPQSGMREPALAYEELAAERQQRERAEERRLFYVALTRARERLILSGAAKFESLGAGNGGAPMSWIAPALVPDIAERLAEAKWGEAEGVQVALASPGHSAPAAAGGAAAAALTAPAAAAPSEPQQPRRAVARLSYSSLAAYQRCSYRFYVEHVLGVPPKPVDAGALDESEGADVLTGVERGVLVHAALERLDFRRAVPVPVTNLVVPGQRRPSSDEAADLNRLLQRFADSDVCRRLGRAARVKREQPFSFLQGELLITGTFDVLAQERPGTLLVLDYKSDQLQGAAPQAVFERYASQRLIYALAALRTGAAQVEVMHVFLEAPDEPLTATYYRSELAVLEQRLQAATAGPRVGAYEPTQEPHRRVCAGCPAEGGLCSWPVSMTRRHTVAQLF